MTSPESLVRAYYALIDEGRTDEMLLLFSPDIVYLRGGTAPIEGAGELREFYERGRIIASGSHEVQTVVSDGRWVAVRGRFIGILKSGVDVDTTFADFFEIDGGSISRRFTYFAEMAV